MEPESIKYYYVRCHDCDKAFRMGDSIKIVLLNPEDLDIYGWHCPNCMTEQRGKVFEEE